MILPIYIIGHPILRQEGADLSLEKSEELEQLISDMFETMYAADGVGLAAQQIGRALKLFIIDGSPMAEDYPELADFKKVFINAKIVKYFPENEIMSEGCLSIPGIRENISRTNKLQIQYYDQDFVFHDEILEGIKARIIQHEYDHTYGILFTDRISLIKRNMLRNRLKELALGNFSANYKTILGNKNSVDAYLFRKVY